MNMDYTERFIVDNSTGIITFTGYDYTCFICGDGLSTEQVLVPINYDESICVF